MDQTLESALEYIKKLEADLAAEAVRIIILQEYLQDSEDARRHLVGELQKVRTDQSYDPVVDVA